MNPERHVEYKTVGVNGTTVNGFLANGVASSRGCGPWRTGCVMLRLTDIFVAGLLLCNAAAVLNEDRFLAKIGWGYESTRSDLPGMKRQIIMLLHASRVLLTIPLMGLNVVVMALKLIMG
jgi:hypothetical protein